MICWTPSGCVKPSVKRLLNSCVALPKAFFLFKVNFKLEVKFVIIQMHLKKGQENCSSPYFSKMFNFSKIPAVTDVHTVTRTTAPLHWCSKLRLNKSRCERGTWSLYSPAPWLLMALCFPELARAN